MRARLFAGSLLLLLLAAPPLLLHSCGFSGPSDTVSASRSNYATLVATPGDSRIALRWEPVTGVSEYDLYWTVEENPGANGKTFRLRNSITGIKSSFYIHHELLNGKTYCYYVNPGGDQSIPPEGDCVPATPGPQGCEFQLQFKCGQACVYPYSDEANCGACGSICAAGQTCENGSCVDRPSATCPDKLDICYGYCSELLMDVSNCGNCGTVCQEGQECHNGLCVGISVGACSAPLTTCGNSCTNLQTDANNCGACGNVCLVDQICSGGGCVCDPAGATPNLCGGACTDTQSDTNNCGACGNVCLAGQICSGGGCVCDPAGATPNLCGGACTDTQIDTNNCGACGTVC
ncbi:MAG: hypothetical protein OEZ32_10280, partial [Nitrospinota bacterium]|nr:hypothetical protein [Nitrospinota bacterium]